MRFFRRVRLAITPFRAGEDDLHGKESRSITEFEKFWQIWWLVSRRTYRSGCLRRRSFEAWGTSRTAWVSPCRRSFSEVHPANQRCFTPGSAAGRSRLKQSANAGTRPHIHTETHSPANRTPCLSSLSLSTASVDCLRSGKQHPARSLRSLHTTSRTTLCALHSFGVDRPHPHSLQPTTSQPCCLPAFLGPPPATIVVRDVERRLTRFDS